MAGFSGKEKQEQFSLRSRSAWAYGSAEAPAIPADGAVVFGEDEGSGRGNVPRDFGSVGQRLGTAC